MRRVKLQEMEICFLWLINFFRFIHFFHTSTYRLLNWHYDYSQAGVMYVHIYKVYSNN